jgi:hypothetical protein
MEQCGELAIQDDPIETLTELIDYMARIGDEIQVKINEMLINACLFIYDGENGGCYDDLEDGATYLAFDEDDLYVKTETPIFKSLKSANCEPTLCAWTVWG